MRLLITRFPIRLGNKRLESRLHECRIAARVFFLEKRETTVITNKVPLPEMLRENIPPSDELRTHASRLRTDRDRMTARRDRIGKMEIITNESKDPRLQILRLILPISLYIRLCVQFRLLEMSNQANGARVTEADDLVPIVTPTVDVSPRLKILAAHFVYKYNVEPAFFARVPGR